ncbi:Methylthioribose-1-phosphate isomerase [Bienertia sinuspersici]
MIPGCGKRIGNGQSTLILDETWAGNSLVKFKRNSSSDQEEIPKTVKDLMRGQYWNSPRVWQWFGKSEAQKILSTYIPQEEREDEIIWLHKENRDYFVKSGYWFIQNLSQQRVHYAFPTRDNLVKRRIEISPTCAFYENKESVDHLFLNCEVTRRIQSSSVLGLNVPSCPTLNTSSWFKNMFIYLHKISDNQNQIWPSLVSITWAIWIHRNNIIFRNEKVNPQEELTLANIESERWHKGSRESAEKMTNNTAGLTKDREPVNWKWGTKTQNENIMKIDGAWKETDRGGPRAAYGWVMEHKNQCVQ